jgi:hypothetical protein
MPWIHVNVNALAKTGLLSNDELSAVLQGTASGHVPRGQGLAVPGRQEMRKGSRCAANHGRGATVIDFKNGAVFKLKPIDASDAVPSVSPMLLPGENVLSAYKGARDFVIFTDKRLIAVNVQGLSGKKRDFSSLPYSKIQVFSVETAGTFDRDAELDLWFSGLGRVRLEFKDSADIVGIGQMIAERVL